MELFWRNKTPENSNQDVSKALLLRGGVAARLEAVARWKGAHFGPTGAVPPAPSISGDYFCAAFLPKVCLFCCHYPRFALSGMDRWVVCWRAGSARAVFVGRQCDPSKEEECDPSEVPPAAAPLRRGTKTQNASLVCGSWGRLGKEALKGNGLGHWNHKLRGNYQLHHTKIGTFQWKCKESEGLTSLC